MTYMQSERNHLYIARKRLGLSLGQVEQYIGINASRLSRLERGIGQPTPDTLAALGDYYGVSVEYLMGRTPDPAPPARELAVAENGAAYITRPAVVAWPPWLDELADLARGMTDRGRAQLIAVARALAGVDSRYARWDWLSGEIDKRDPTLLDRVEQSLVQLELSLGSRDAALDALIAFLEGDEAAQQQPQ